MRISRLSQEVKGFQVISVTNGEIIAEVQDVMIDLNNLQVAAVVTSKGNILKTKLELIVRDDVQVWGEDVILVSEPDVIHDEEELKGAGNWESSIEKVSGKKVIDTNGDQIGELNDVVIDSEAKILGYDLSSISLEGPVADTKRIHVNTTQAMGADALIIDTTKLYQWEM
jgi:uncharacterized protein YrrD